MSQQSLFPDQPDPQPGHGDVWLDVIQEFERKMPEHVRDDSPIAKMLAAMKERRALGFAKYGCPLQYNNGRDATIDAVQEALDGIAYSRQAGNRVAEAYFLCALIELLGGSAAMAL